MKAKRLENMGASIKPMNMKALSRSTVNSLVKVSKTNELWLLARRLLAVKRR
jgi:hypothetical protein